ncbi:MAG: LLM class flavin-dependent oxidoreductase [Nitrososphaerales archaeon]
MQFAAATLGEEPIDRLAGIVKLCETLGYDDFFHADEKYTRDPYVSLGYCAALTSKIGLGITVTDPHTRHPAISAQAIATLEEASGGRLSITIGAGSHFETLGIQRKNTVVAIREATYLIRKLLTGEDIELHGKVVNFNKGHLDFKPARVTPIYVAARGVGTLSLAGEIGDGVVIGSFATRKGLIYCTNLVKEGAKKAGRDYDSIKKLLWAYGCIAKKPEDAYAAVKRGISHALWSSRELWASGELETQVGVKLPEKLTKFVKDAPKDWREETMSELRSLIPDTLVEDLAVAGTAETVIQKLKMMTELGIDETIVWAHAAKGQNLEDVFAMYSYEVMPLFGKAR